MLTVLLPLLSNGAEPLSVPHTDHAEVALTGTRDIRAPLAGLAGGWDGRVQLMGRAEAWPHTRANELEDALDTEVRRPISHARLQLRAGYDVVDGVRLGAVVDAEHGLRVARPYTPVEGPVRRGNLWLGPRLAVGPTFDAWRVRGVVEAARTPTREGFDGPEFGMMWRSWLDVDVHHENLVVTVELGLGQRSWRYPSVSAGSTNGLQPMSRVTLGIRM